MTEVFFVQANDDAQREDEGWYAWPETAQEPQGPYPTREDALNAARV